MLLTMFPHIGVVEEAFKPYSVENALKLHNRDQEYPEVEQNSNKKRAVFISLCDQRSHVAVFVAPMEPFHKKSEVFGKMGHIMTPFEFFTNDREGSGNLYHLVLRNQLKQELPENVREVYLLNVEEMTLMAWSQKFKTQWFAGYTCLTDEKLDELAILILYKFQKK